MKSKVAQQSDDDFDLDEELLEDMYWYTWLSSWDAKKQAAKQQPDKYDFFDE
jgi:hypothetical protein